MPFQPPANVSGSGTVRAPDPKPRYVELPASPDRFRGPRNLAWGVIFLLLASFVFWMGLYLAGRTALRLMVASFGTFGLLWILYSMRVLRQRHGTLMAVGMVALFAAVIPFAELGFQKLDRLARTRLAGEPDGSSAENLAPPPPAQPGQPVKPEIPPAPEASAPPPSDGIVRELMLPPPDPTAGKLIRVSQDTQVTIGGRQFLIRAGNQFPFKKFADGAVTFLAGEQEVTIDAELVSFTGRSQETPAEITKLAMEELKRRYPGIFEKGTPENEVFVARKKELDEVMPEFFKGNPRWPLDLGEQLAAQEKWPRADRAPEESAPEPQDAPPPNNVPVQTKEVPVEADLLPPQVSPPLPPLPKLPPARSN